jgi:putative superfamily III holin-X
MNDLHVESEVTATRLVSGIMTDAQQLIKQQLALLRHEVKDDLHKTKQASRSLVGGTLISLVGGILLALMLVHFLSRSALELPLWVCYGIVGVPIAAIGVALYFVGIHKFKSLNPMSSESAQALTETFQWKTNRK